MGQLGIKELYLGKTDAYNEFVSFGKETCRNVFFEFPNIDLQSVLNGNYYYFCGDKGTGKTMLLKYVETIVQEGDNPAFTAFIRFKKDVDDEQRNQIKHLGTSVASEETIEDYRSIDASIDCSLAWQVYLIKTVIFTLEYAESGVFERNDTWKQLLGLLHEVYHTNHRKKVCAVIPKAKRGSVEINVANVVKLGLELEWEGKEENKIPFQQLARIIIDLYSRLSASDETMYTESFYVFVDELELSFKKNRQYERDIVLIRDLILAIQSLSEITREQGYHVFFLSGIRNEVYRAVKSMGMEINKPIHDFGIQLSWQHKGGDIREHPLLQMLRKRIEYSEQIRGLEPTCDVWASYFCREVNNKNVCNYIINQTWDKPRDIIRLFTTIQMQYGEESFFDQKIFDSIRQQYSTESWEELVEALCAQYSPKEIEGIRHVLTGISLPFSRNDFLNRIRSLSDCYQDVDSLNSYRIDEVLCYLYDVGVIGNYGAVPRFVFLGDRDLDPASPMTIHYPLIKFFRASIKPKNNSTADKYRKRT